MSDVDRISYVSVSKLEIPEEEQYLVEEYEDTLDSTLARVSDDLDKREGSIISDALSPMCFEISRQRYLFRDIMELAFASTSEGYYLDLIGRDYGIERYQAQACHLTMKFVGTPGATVYSDTLVGLPDIDTYEFLTNEEVIIGDEGFATVEARCNVEGKVANIDLDTVTLLLDDRYNDEITSVTNITRDSGGIDTESDDDFRARCLYQRRFGNSGGKAEDFKKWAYSVAGVIYVEVFNKKRGTGTVDVVIAVNPDMDEETVLNNVKEEVLGNSYGGLDVKVELVTKVDVTFNIKVSGISNDDAYRVVVNYLNNLGVGVGVILSGIIAELMNAGATDVIITSPTSNVNVDSDKVLNPTVNITQIT